MGRANLPRKIRRIRSEESLKILPTAPDLFRCLTSETIAAIRYMIARMMSRGAAKTQIGSLSVVDLIANGSSEALFERLRAACALIERHDPQRFRRFQQDVSRIVFLETGPEYWHRGRICVLHDIATLNDMQVATHLVHEGAHARLYASGIQYTRRLKTRIEHACVREELRFLARVPASEPFIERALQKFDESWWTADAVRERHLESLANARAPALVVRAYKKLSERRASPSKQSRSE